MNWFESQLLKTYEMDVFVREKFLTSDTIQFIKRDVEEDIAKCWGYRAENITVIRYPFILPSGNWTIEDRTKTHRVYVNSLTGEQKIVRGKIHGDGFIYQWCVRCLICGNRLSHFLRELLPK